MDAMTEKTDDAAKTFDCSDCYAVAVEKEGDACEFCQKRFQLEWDLGVAALHNEDLFWGKLPAARVEAVLAAAPPAATSSRKTKTFEMVWLEKMAEGYQYGDDALEQVKFGWELAMKAVKDAKGE
jgi:hypothetical protein